MQDIKQTLEQSGVAMSQMPTGIPRTRYYTPDGREEWKIPQQRERRDGLVYDIFIAQGYTLTPPVNPKLYCKGCDRWHDTKTEVDECVGKKEKFAVLMTSRAERELAKGQKGKDKTIADLEARIKLLEAQFGTKI